MSGPLWPGKFYYLASTNKKTCVCENTGLRAKEKTNSLCNKKHQLIQYLLLPLMELKYFFGNTPYLFLKAALKWLILV